MDSFIERVDIFEQLDDARHIARDALELVYAGKMEDAAEKIGMVYPKLRFINENLNRYRFVLRFIDRTAHVLDVPCGTGYGSAILVSVAAKVYGIDINHEAIDYAGDMFGYKNLDFYVSDMRTDKFPDVNVIVCFEGLEHVADGDLLIRRFAEALSDGGLLFISVPVNEKLINPEDNPYHLAEYTLDSLRELLERYFDTVVFFSIDRDGNVADVRYALTSIIAVCEI